MFNFLSSVIVAALRRAFVSPDTATFELEDPVLLGYRDGGFLTDGLPFEISWNAARSHTMMTGAVGSGMDGYLKLYASNAISSGKGLLVLDVKNNGLLESVEEASRKHGRLDDLRVIDFNDSPLDAVSIQSDVDAMLNYGTHAPEEHLVFAELIDAAHVIERGGILHVVLPAADPENLVAKATFMAIKRAISVALNKLVNPEVLWKRGHDSVFLLNDFEKYCLAPTGGTVWAMARALGIQIFCAGYPSAKDYQNDILRTVEANCLTRIYLADFHGQTEENFAIRKKLLVGDGSDRRLQDIKPYEAYVFTVDQVTKRLMRKWLNPYRPRFAKIRLEASPC